MKFQFTIFCLILFCSCYNESDYQIDSDKSKDLFKVSVDKNTLLADSFSTAQITVIFDNSVDSTKSSTLFKTTLGTFVESNSNSFTTTPKYNYDTSKLISTVKLKSPLTVDSAIVSIQVAGFSKSITIKFNKSYPEFITLSANTLAVKPKNNQEGEVIFTNKISKTIGFSNVNTLVDLGVFDSAFHAIGSFRTYSNKTDASGITTYTYVLGDSLANGYNYEGKLYAISKVRTNENPIIFKSDTVIFISSK